MAPFSASWKPRTLAEGVEDGLRELLGAGPIPFPERAERVFQPWHRPRKQYVRGVQWAQEVRRLAKDLRLATELRYLTLPGSDLLDIRHLAESVCQPCQIRLRYLGFNNSASPADLGRTELNTSQFSINRLEFIHPESEVVVGDFRSVGNPRSVPWRRVHRAGPFHVINIDLCGGFAGQEKAAGIPNYFTALQALLQNQRHSSEDFLLFITTRMDDANVDEKVKESLNGVAQAIFETCEDYASEFSAAWGVPREVAKVGVSEVVTPAEGFMLGLTQWIVSQGVSQGLKASVRDFMTYRTGSEVGDDDIVSLAIRFKPDPYIQRDPQGLVRPVGGQLSLDQKECAQSASIPSRVSHRARVDEILRTQADAFERCVRESAELLSAAGYDAGSYHAWVMEEADRYAEA